jgi:hypothetical protein
VSQDEGVVGRRRGVVEDAADRGAVGRRLGERKNLSASGAHRCAAG